MEIIIQVIAFLLQFLYKEKLNKVSAITILLFSARFSLIIATFASSELPQNSTGSFECHVIFIRFYNCS